MSHDLIPSRHTFVVWPREGDPTYVVIASEEGTARLETRIKDIRTYTEFAVAPAALLAQVLREKDLAGKRLGIEQRGLTLDLRYAPEAAARVRQLVEQERTCCAFLQFDLYEDDHEVRLLVTAPPAAADAVPDLLAELTGRRS